LHSERTYNGHQQKNFFSDNVDTAISLVQGDAPRVLTLITECFEASLFLLVDRYPQFFSTRATHAFLNASFIRNARRNTVDNDQGDAHQDDMHELRVKAMTWFYEDHLFYDAAVDQFRQHLTASNVEPSIVKDCKQRLDERAILNNKILLDTGLHDGRMHQADVQSIYKEK
jgi:hypothetical protein